jgi:hypothetical protein
MPSPEWAFNTVQKSSRKLVPKTGLIERREDRGERRPLRPVVELLDVAVLLWRPEHVHGDRLRHADAYPRNDHLLLSRDHLNAWT